MTSSAMGRLKGHSAEQVAKVASASLLGSAPGTVDNGCADRFGRYRHDSRRMKCGFIVAHMYCASYQYLANLSPDNAACPGSCAIDDGTEEAILDGVPAAHGGGRSSNDVSRRYYFRIMNRITCLPNELLYLILSKLDATALTCMLAVCRKLRALALQESLWHALAVHERADFGCKDPASSAKHFRTLTRAYDGVNSWKSLTQKAARINRHWGAGDQSTPDGVCCRPSIIRFCCPHHVRNFRTKADYASGLIYVSTRSSEIHPATGHIDAAHRGIFAFHVENGCTNAEPLLDALAGDEEAPNHLHLEGDGEYLVAPMGIARLIQLPHAVATLTRLTFMVFKRPGGREVVQPHYATDDPLGHALRVKLCGSEAFLFTVTTAGLGLITELATAQVVSSFQMGHRAPQYVDFDENYAISVDSRRLWVHDRHGSQRTYVVYEQPRQARLQHRECKFIACHIDGLQVIAIDSEGSLVWISNLPLFLRRPELRARLVHEINFGVACTALSVYRGRVAIEMLHLPLHDLADDIASGDEVDFYERFSLLSQKLQTLSPLGSSDSRQCFLLVFDTPSAPGRDGSLEIEENKKASVDDLQQSRGDVPSRNLSAYFAKGGPFGLIAHIRISSGQKVPGGSLHIDDTSIITEGVTDPELVNDGTTDSVVMLDWSEPGQADRVVQLRLPARE